MPGICRAFEYSGSELLLQLLTGKLFARLTAESFTELFQATLTDWCCDAAESSERCGSDIIRSASTEI